MDRREREKHSAVQTHWQNRVAMERDLHHLRLENIALWDYLTVIRKACACATNATESADMLEALSELLTATLDVVDATDGSLLAVDETNKELVFVLTHGGIPEDQLRWKRLTPGQGIAGHAVKSGRSIIVNNPVGDPRFDPSLDQEFSFETKCLLAVPVLDGGEAIGVLEVLNKRGSGKFDERDENLVTVSTDVAVRLLRNLVAAEKPKKTTVARKKKTPVRKKAAAVRGATSKKKRVVKKITASQK